MGRCAMVVELERDADDVIALGLEQRRGHRRIDAAGHGDDDAGVLRTPFDLQAVAHSGRGLAALLADPGNEGLGHYYRHPLPPRNARKPSQERTKPPPGRIFPAFAEAARPGLPSGRRTNLKH